jgi:hypothetical protein
MGAQAGAHRPEDLVCTAVTKAGARCRGYRQAGQELCRLHAPEAAQDRAKGLAAAQTLREAESAKEAAEEADRAAQVQLTTPEEVRAFIQETATRLRAGAIPAATAVALDRLARTSLAAIDSALLAEAQREIDSSKAARPAGIRRRP